jgi:hypothetical protein
VHGTDGAGEPVTTDFDSDMVNRRLRLADGVLLFARDAVPQELHASLPEGAEFVLTALRSRRNSLVVDRACARLIAWFDEPMTLADAIAARAKESGYGAEALAREAAEFLHEVITAGFLVPADGAEAPRPAVGCPVLPFPGVTATTCLRWLDDSAVYRGHDRLGRAVVVKVVHPGAPGWVRAALRREHEVLLELATAGGGPAPAAHAYAEEDGYSMLVMDHVDGRAIGRVAQDLRQRLRHGDLFTMIGDLIERYAELHDAGVLHGDVHDGNVLVGPDGVITLIDFGLAQVGGLAARQPVPRGGLTEQADPDYAGHLLTGGDEPPYSASAEQYAVAALVYRLLSGAHHTGGNLAKDAMLGEIAAATYRPLDRATAAAPVGAERALTIALSRRAELRYPTMRAWRRAWLAATTPGPGREPVSLRPPRTGSGRSEHPIEGFVIGLEAQVAELPRASVALGRPGLLLALLHAAQSLSDAKLFQCAQDVARYALRTAGDDEYVLEDVTRPDAFDLRSVAFGRAGHAFVACHLHAALGDVRAARRTFRRLRSTTQHIALHADVAVGRLGAVVALCQLVRRYGELVLPAAQRALLWDELSRTMEDICGKRPWERLEAVPGSMRPYLGLAHGYAGALYAAAAVRTAGGCPLPPWAWELAEWLRSAAMTTASGLRWPVEAGGGAFWPGWCHGQAGHLMAWTALYEATREEWVLTVADRAGAHLSSQPVPTMATLCCGSAGVAYALAGLHHVGADQRHLAAAERVAAAAMQAGRSAFAVPDSLWKGVWGTACLRADVDSGRFASPPLFGGFPG